MEFRGKSIAIRATISYSTSKRLERRIRRLKFLYVCKVAPPSIIKQLLELLDKYRACYRQTDVMNSRNSTMNNRIVPEPSRLEPLLAWVEIR